MGFIQAVDDAFNSSFLGRFFEMEERRTKFSIELRGALATFMSTAYILAVNPRIISDSGGPCEVGPDGNIFSDEYSRCVEDVRKELVTSTALSAMFGCFFMGLGANLPVALAPGMGMNAYFTYSVVGFRGTGGTSYDAAITAVLIEGAIFFLLAVSGVRYALVKLIPEPVRLATPAAIGAFLAHLGLQTAEGIGVVVSDIATAVTLGACPLSKRTPIVALTPDCRANSDFCVTSDAYTCDDEGGVMTSAMAWIGMLGTVIMLILLAYRVQSAFLIGIGFVTFLSWFRDTSITYFPDTQDGNERFEYFKQLVSLESLDKVFANYTGDLADVGVALFTFLYVDFLDTSGTLLAIVSSMGYVDEDGNFPRASRAFAADAMATMFGSLFGTSPVTSYIESGAGVEAGSRTGLTAIFCGIFFFFSLFFAPIIASIPPWATGGALIIVGSLMARSLGQVKWYNLTHAATAFITVIVMPLTYSIAYGLIAGIGTFVLMEGTFFALSFVGIEKPVFEDPDAISADETKRTSDQAEEKEVKEEAAVVVDDEDNEKGKDEDA